MPPPVPCSVPDCDYETPEGTKEQILSYLTLHTNAVHLVHQPAAPAAPAVPVSKMDKLPRPVFSLNMTEAQWQYKEIDWNSYINQAPSSDNAKLLQLRATCGESLRQRVCDSGGWSLQTVPELLAKMKELAVIKIHKSRHMANLYKITQQSDEPVRAFVARLTGTADCCGMTVKCPTCQVDLSYRDEVVKPMIIHGLANNEIKQRVLSRTGNDELKSLAELVSYIASEESSFSESSSSSPDPNLVGHVGGRKSSYKKNLGKCNFCGGPRHTNSNTSEDRQKLCKAFGKMCSKCGKPNHFSSVCQSSPRINSKVSNIETDPDDIK
jgi:hypothetical protein